MDPYGALEAAVSSTDHVVKGIRGKDLAVSTPCSEWNVKQLMNHVVGTLWLADGLFNDRKPRYAVAPGALPKSDLVGDDPAKAYAKASRVALDAAAADGAIGGTHDTPLGMMPGVALAGFTTMDVLVHGWDLAQATGQSTDPDDDLVALVTAFAKQAITDATRAPTIGPAVRAPRGATPIQKLVAYLGRTL
ncbi:MAG: TIGR03086 family metal-binding protein [Actinomycetota bacterium]